MARISTYGAESDIVGGDKWIGTAVNQNNATKNFTADAVAAFLNSSGSINSQTLRYTYKNVPIGDEREKNSLSFLTELGASVAFSSITNFVLSQYSKPGTTDVSTFYDAPLVGSNILLTNASNPKDWAIYTWNSSTQIVLEPLFYDIGLTFVAGTGGLVDDADYIISLLEYDTGSSIPTLSDVLISGNNSGANGIFFDGATKAVFNTDLQIYSDAVIGYILADTLHIETENDISLKSDTQVTFNILNSDKLKITSLGVTVEGRVSQTTLGESTFFGDRAGENDDLTNRQNTSFGFKALQANILGTSNTAIGYSALLNNTGESNTAIGFASLTTNTLGIYNTGVGIYSLRDNLSGIYNTAFGTRSLISNTSGNYNISVGVDSLGDNTIGDYNISMGRNSGRYITDGSTSNTEPLNSIFIGNSTKALADSQTNQIVIGDGAIGNGSNSVVLGNNSILTTKLKGDVSISGALLDSSSSAGTSGQVLSSTVTGTDWIDNDDDTLMPTITIGASRSLLLTDRNNNIENSSTVTINIPLNSSVAFPIGSQIYFTKKFVTMDFAVTAGVTLNSVDNLVDMGRINCGAALLKIATDEWNLVGELI